MKTWPSLSAVHTPSMFSLLLLAVSLNAQNQSWDVFNCTEGVLSVPRGSRSVMTCNSSSDFTDVTIWLDDKIIFNKMPQGYFLWEGWELHVQGGQAQLVINDTQDVHTGLYLWHLRGLQGDIRSVTLNVSDALIQPKRALLGAGPQTLMGVVVAGILILGLAVCYRYHRSKRSPWICTSVTGLRRRF
ncbi:Secreted and transmembrane protein 1A [Lemmus lemmus]